MNRTQLQQQVECPVCMDQFQTPKQLPCQHTFCMQCLQNIHNNDRGPQIRCPECRQQHRIPPNGIADFPTSVSIQRFIEAMSQPNVPQSHVQPSAPPTRATRDTMPYPLRPINDAHISEVDGDVDQDIVRVISFMERQQQLERNTNVNQPSRDRRRIQTHTNIHQPPGYGREIQTLRTAPQVNQNTQQNISIQRSSDNAPRSTFQTGRSAYRRYIGHLFHNSEEVQWILITIMFTMTFSRFVAGAFKLGSDCNDEYNVAVYSFVKSWFGFLFYGTFIVLEMSTNIDRALDNKFVQGWLILHELFTVIWFFIGTAWVFGKYAEMKTECPTYVEDWNFHFINFILFLTVVDWILFVVFVFYSGYFLCETERNETEN